MKPFEAIKMMPGTQLALLLVTIVTLAMVGVSLSIHLLVEPINNAARDKILATLGENQEIITRTITTVDFNTRQNDRNLQYINESIAGSTATVENQKVIIDYLTAVILQNNQSLEQGKQLTNLTQFLRSNFNETFIEEIREDNLKTGQILGNLTELLKFEAEEHNLRNSNNTIQ